MHLKNSKVIVIKIGSSLLVDNTRKIRKKWLSSFAKDIQKLKSKNKKCEILTMTTLEKSSISKIKAKLLSYVS